MTQCSDLIELYKKVERCRQTDFGARIETHCLYPSFEPVYVYVAGFGSGFKVSDGGGAVRSALLHGRGDEALHSALSEIAKEFLISKKNDVLEVSVESKDWLYSAILSIANASALAARSAVLHADESSMTSFRKEISNLISVKFPNLKVESDHKEQGVSGKVWKFDGFIPGRKPILYKAVSPHHVSVNSAFAAFSDVREKDNFFRYSVFRERLDEDDFALLNQVSQIVPLQKLPEEIDRRSSRDTLVG